MLDFLGIGAQKSGTTWLYRMLEKHPQLNFPWGKEAHFWNSLTERDPASYLEAFEHALPEVRNGEITPAYALLDNATIRRIHATNHGMRILFLMRSPLERAWSSAQMALRRAELEIDEASDSWFIDHFRSAGSLGRGDYEATLRRWRQVFPSEQVLVLRYEDLRDDPRSLLRSCAHHLGVSGKVLTDLPDPVLSERVFAGPGHPMPPALRTELVRIYRSRVESLASYLGRDLSAWLD